MAKGRTEGLAAGRAAAAEETRRLREIAGSFSAAVEQANGAIADDLLNLALDLAKAMLNRPRPSL